MKKATSSDVAHLAGVSQSTVSLILNNKANLSFSEETKDKVLEAARQLGYKIPAQNIPTLEKNLIAVFTPTLSNPYYTQLTSDIEQYAMNQGYKIIVCNTSRKKDYENYYLDFFNRTKVAGIIFTFVPSFPKLVEQLALSIPIILIGEKTKDLSIPSIELSNIKAGILIAEHLVSLGHKHFAFLTTPMNNLTLAREQRLLGVKSVLKEQGLQDNLVLLTSDEIPESDINSAPYEYEVGYNLSQKLLKSHCKATAFIGVNDMTALGIIAGITELGYCVPKDYSVCGFDNIFMSNIFIPTITTVDHHLHLRGQSAIDMITSKQKENENTITHLSSQVNKIEYEPKLLVRNSTGICSFS